jgi:hypothetical protein
MAQTTESMIRSRELEPRVLVTPRTNGLDVAGPIACVHISQGGSSGHFLRHMGMDQLLKLQT